MSPDDLLHLGRQVVAARDGHKRPVLLENRTWFSASKVDIQTMRPHPLDTRVICSTAAGLMPPIMRFQVDSPEDLHVGDQLAHHEDQTRRSTRSGS